MKSLRYKIIPKGMAIAKNAIKPVKVAKSGDISKKSQIFSVIAVWSNKAIVIKPKQ